MQNSTVHVLFFIGCFIWASFALALIALACDIELNLWYQNFDSIETARGLKIAPLSIHSLKNKTDTLYLEVIDSKSVDVLTLSKT